MKTVTIVSGNFATSENNQGNFTGYTSVGERIFVNKQLMTNLGITENAHFKAPLFAVIAERQFDVLDENKQPTGKTFTRTQALSIFSKVEEISEAVNADFKMQVTITKDRKAIAESAELDDETVNKLISASIF